jgi:hypothetical protein
MRQFGQVTHRTRIRNLVITILRLAGYVSIAAAPRHAARHPMPAFRLLTGRK